MPPNHLIVCCPLLLLPSMFPSIRVFYSELALFIRWPKYWSFSINPSSEYSRLISIRIDRFVLLAVRGSFKSLLQHQFESINSSYVCMCLCVYVCITYTYVHTYIHIYMDSIVKNPPTNAGDVGSILGLRRSPGEEKGNPLRYSCLGNPMDREAWWTIVYEV